jgi:predicted nucleotidyltransferase
MKDAAGRVIGFELLHYRPPRAEAGLAVETVVRTAPSRERLTSGESGWVGDMGVEELLKEKREEILKIAAKHGARNVRVFGSVVRGEADEQSDVDFLVDMEPGRSLLDMGGLLMDLRELLGRDVDVITERGLKPRIRARVLKEAVAL